MNKNLIKGLLAGALGALLLASPAQATLLERGGGMVYDTELNITWLQNWNQGAGSGYDDEFGLGGTGLMTWVNAKSWADDLVFGGYSDWRLPTLGPVNGSTFQYECSNNGSTDCGTAKTGTGWGKASEMGHLFYVTLGNKGYCTPNDADPANCDTEQAGWGLNQTGPFRNMQSYYYWSGLEYAGYARTAWSFNTILGDQFYVDEGNAWYAVAVRAGDVAAVPEPESGALLLLGLSGLAMVRRQGSR